MPLQKVCLQLIFCIAVLSHKLYWFNVLKLVGSLVRKKLMDGISFEVKISIIDGSVRIFQSAEHVLIICL